MHREINKTIYIRKTEDIQAVGLFVKHTFDLVKVVVQSQEQRRSPNNDEQGPRKGNHRLDNLISIYALKANNLTLFLQSHRSTT